MKVRRESEHFQSHVNWNDPVRIFLLHITYTNICTRLYTCRYNSQNFEFVELPSDGGNCDLSLCLESTRILLAQMVQTGCKSKDLCYFLGDGLID